MILAVPTRARGRLRKRTRKHSWRNDELCLKNDQVLSARALLSCRRMAGTLRGGSNALYP